MARNQWLAEIAESIADGVAIDWTDFDGRSLEAGDDEILRRLKSIEEIVRAHSTPFSETKAPAAWGHLRIRERIGGGAHGDVYRAYDGRLDRDVALKLLKPGRHYSDSTVVAEARLMGKIRHPGVVVVYGADTIAGVTGIWMELLDGGSLADRVRDTGPLDSAEIVRVGADLCDAITAITKAGLLHRDVKAQNVLFEKSGRVVLVDFGTGRELSNGFGVSGDLVGTPAYLAPEVLFGGPHTDKSEVYSLGVLLHFAASGGLPVGGRSLEELRANHRSGQHVPTAQAAPALSSEVAAAIESALEAEPEARHVSATRFRRSLKAALLISQRRSSAMLLGLLRSPVNRSGAARLLIQRELAKKHRESWLSRGIYRCSYDVGLALQFIIRIAREVHLIPVMWAASAGFCLAILPAFFLATQARGPVNTIQVIDQLIGIWPLSLFYAVALPFRSYSPPIGATALTGSVVGFVFLWMQPLRTAMRATVGAPMLTAGERLRELVVWNPHRAIFSLSYASLALALILLGASVTHLSRRRRRFLLWGVPFVYIGLLKSQPALAAALKATGFSILAGPTWFIALLAGLLAIRFRQVRQKPPAEELD